VNKMTIQTQKLIDKIEDKLKSFFSYLKEKWNDKWYSFNHWTRMLERNYPYTSLLTLIGIAIVLSIIFWVTL